LEDIFSRDIIHFLALTRAFIEQICFCTTGGSYQLGWIYQKLLSQ